MTYISCQRLSSFITWRFHPFWPVVSENPLPSKGSSTRVFEKTIVSEKKPVVHRFLEDELGWISLSRAVELFFMLLDALQRTGLREKLRIREEEGSYSVLTSWTLVSWVLA